MGGGGRRMEKVPFKVGALSSIRCMHAVNSVADRDPIVAPRATIERTIGLTNC